MVQVNMIPFHGEKRKTQQPNQHKQATKPQRNNTKKHKNTTRTKTSRSGMTYPKATMKQAGGTAQVAIVAQPSTGFLNGRFYADKSPTKDTEDCLGRTTVGLTRSKSLTILVSPLDMLGLMGMAQVVATIALASGD